MNQQESKVKNNDEVLDPNSPEVQRAAVYSPILDGMIRRGTPITRAAWLELAYGPDRPGDDEWNAEHEAGVPRPLRRDVA
jgi:hypothetical protein